MGSDLDEVLEQYATCGLSAQRRRGARSERISGYSTGDLAYILEIERSRAEWKMIDLE